MNLQSLPILLARTPDQIEPLAAAQGRNLLAEKLTGYALGTFFGVCLGALAFVLLTGCTPGQQLAFETAASVGQEVACALCQKPIPAPPAVSPNPSPSDLLGLAAWAASVEVRMHDVQRSVAEELAKRAAALPEQPPPPAPAPVPAPLPPALPPGPTPAVKGSPEGAGGPS